MSQRGQSLVMLLDKNLSSSWMLPVHPLLPVHPISTVYLEQGHFMFLQQDLLSPWELLASRFPQNPHRLIFLYASGSRSCPEVSPGPEKWPLWPVTFKCQHIFSFCSYMAGKAGGQQTFSLPYVLTRIMTDVVNYGAVVFWGATELLTCSSFCNQRGAGRFSLMR